LQKTEFAQMMQPLLGSEWSDFAEALHAEPTRGARLHRMDNPSIPPSVSDCLLQKIPWSENGYYIDLHSPLGKSVYHESGAYYLQEPSAMAVVEALRPIPGERILDLCAAPGGKCTEIGRRLAGKGLLVANEIHKNRVVILAENIERLGIQAVVTQESADRLAAAWPEYFDAILVDAPCSGEGMFRKDKTAMSEWSPEAPRICSDRQKQILTSASKLIRPGGRMVYSTCTFNPYENEQIVDWLVSELGFTVEPLPDWPEWSKGVPEWGSGLSYLLGCKRLWPHLARGEGHFVARLRKPGSTKELHSNTKTLRHKKVQQVSPNNLWKDWTQSFLASAELPASWQEPIVRGTLLFSAELSMLPDAKLKVLRPGICLASMENYGLVPHHALAMAMAAKELQNQCAISEQDALSYCKGYPLSGDSSRNDIKGYCQITIDKFPLGWGKGIGTRINNLYPKGLRKQHLVQLGIDSTGK
jgi:NOL1/NOP2/sun family putative RNA methylase